jgi:nucleoside-diphosphate-sugar epimerase
VPVPLRVLIIGGTRFIGTAVARRLARSHSVTLFHRLKSGARVPSGCREIFGDRVDLASFTEDFERLGPDVVLDMIPLREKDARSVMEVFRGIASRLVAVSSQDVYRAYGRLIGLEPGPPDAVPLTEDSPLRETLYPYRKEASGPDDLRYDYDKIPAERVFLSDPELPGTVLRLPMVFGPGDYQHRIHGYRKRMDDERPAILLEEGTESWRSSLGYVENVGDAIALAVTDERAAGEIYNVGEAKAPTTREWIESIAQAVRWPGRVVVCPKGQLPSHLSMGIDPRHDLVASTSKIRRELGFQEGIPLKEALRRTIEWERANPPDKIGPNDDDYAAEDDVLKQLGVL